MIRYECDSCGVELKKEELLKSSDVFDWVMKSAEGELLHDHEDKGLHRVSTYCCLEDEEKPLHATECELSKEKEDGDSIKETESEEGGNEDT